MKISGIYKTINKINGKYYVGSSCDIFEDRWAQHKANLRHNNHGNNHLQNAWNKYGEQNFNVVVVEKTNELLVREQYFLDIAKTEKDKCYNLSFIADRPEMTAETRQKLSRLAKLQLADKTNHPFYGKHHTNKTKRLIAERSVKYGKENGMFGVKRYGKDNPNFGNHKLKGASNPSFDRSIFSFRNTITKETFTGTKYDFYTKYGLSQGNVSWLVKGKHKSVKGWSIISCLPHQEI